MRTLSKFSLIKLVHSLIILLIFISNNAYSQQKTMGVTKYLYGHEDDGYILYSAIGSDTTYLINKCGKKVHTWVSQYGPGLSMYLLPNGNLLRTASLSDTGFGIAGGRGGIIEEFNWGGQLLWSYKLLNDSLCQHHDITPLPNGNILILAWHAIKKSSAIALGRDSGNFMSDELWGERILEIKPQGIDSADIVWQWDLFDHVVQDINPTLPNYGVINQHPELMNINYALNLKTFDWIHANGLDYNKDLDQIIISCHNISEFWIIDHSTSIKQAKLHTGGRYGRGGDFLYRWGNPISYNMGQTSDRKLFRQHNVQWIRNGLQDSGKIMCFNNGWERDTLYSSIDIITPPVNSSGVYNSTVPYGPSSQSWIYKDSIPTNFYSKIISGAQRLPNGNTLICNGIWGIFFEITPNKKKVWEYQCPFNSANNTNFADGDAPGYNSVFRCTFYRNNYQAFAGRMLTPTGTVERNPYPFACNYDRTPPKPVTFTPQLNEVEVGPTPVLKVIFNESLVKKTGNIKIFQNNTLLETIAITSSKVKVNNNILTIQQSSTFAINSRISILIPANAFTDSSFNLTAAIDSSQWHFNTEMRFGYTSFYPANLSTDVNPLTSVSVTFTDIITKGTTGSVYLFENSVLKEQLPVSSPRITVNGNTATIAPTTGFSQDANVSIIVESCFRNAGGSFNTPITSGTWGFSTLNTPTIVTLSPLNKAKNVPVNTTLSIGFNHPIANGNSGYLKVYEDNFLMDSILVDGPRAMINNNTISFDINTDFNYLSRVSVSMEQGVLRDTFGAFTKAIDSSEWSFTVVKSSSGIDRQFVNNSFTVYPNPNKGNMTVTSKIKIEKIEVFNMNGQKIQTMDVRLNDNTYEIKLKNPVAGAYMILVNGTYPSNIIIE